MSKQRPEGELLESYGFTKKEYINYNYYWLIFEHYDTMGLCRDMKISVSESSNPKLFINDSFIRSVETMDEVKAVYKAITDKELMQMKPFLRPEDQDDLPF